MVPRCYMLCLYVYGLQQYGLLKNSWPLCFLFCSVVLIGCFGFNGPLRQFFVYIGPSPKEREKEERKDR